MTQPTSDHPQSDIRASARPSELQQLGGDPLAEVQAALAEGRAVDVVSTLEGELEKLQLTTAATLAVLAGAYEQLGDVSSRDDANVQALSLIDRTHATPDAAEAVALSGLLQASSRSEDALRLLRSAAEAPPRDPGVAHTLAERLRDCGDLSTAARLLSNLAHIEPTDAAVDLLREAVELDVENLELQTQLGAAMLIAGDVPGALEVLDKAASRVQPTHNAHGWLAEAERRAGNIDGALGRAESILRANADDRMALRVSAECNRAQDKLDLAIDRFARIVALDPGDTEARIRHIDLLREAGHTDDAILQARGLVDLHPDQPLPHALLGEELARRGDYLAAITALDSSLALDPENRSVRMMRTEVLRRQGRLEEAGRELEHLLAEDPDDAYALGTHGQVLIARGFLEQGIESLEHALALSDHLSWALADKAFAEAKLGRAQDALDTLDRLIEERPDDLSARVFKGEILLDRGDAGGALEEADVVLAQLPMDASANLLHAGALLAKGHAEQAIDPLGRAITTLRAARAAAEADDAQPVANLRRAHLLRGATLASLARWSEAAEDYEATLDLDEEDDVALLERGRCHYMLREWDAAARRFEAAVASARARDDAPVEAESLALLGEIERVEGKWETALEKLERSLELMPRAAFALATKGQVLGAIGRTEEAKQALSEAVEIDGTVTWAHESLSELLRLDGDYQGALEELQKAIPESGEMSAWTRATRGQIFAGLGESARALDDLREAWAMGHETWIASALANQLATVGGQAELDEALEVIDSAIDRFPSEKELLVSKSEILRVAGRSAEGLSLIDQYLTLAPDDARAKGTQAHLLVDNRLYDAGLGIAEGLIESNPRDSFARTAACRALLNLERATEALEQSRQVLRYEALEPTAQVLEISALAALGRWQECIEACERALDRDPASESASVTAGFATRRLEGGSVERAVEYLRRAVEVAPNDLSTRVELADSLSEAGQDEEALQLRTGVIAELERSRRNDAYDLAAAGWAALWTKQAERSVEWLGDARQIEPDRMPFQFAFVSALVGAERDALAIDELEGVVSRALALPDRERVRALLDESSRDFAGGPIIELRGSRAAVVEQAQGILSKALDELEGTGR